MKPGLQLRPSQHLALTPQLQQSIRLLQLSTLELQAEIEQALQDNPLLELQEREAREAGIDAPETQLHQRQERQRSLGQEVDDLAALQAAPEPGLTDHLLEQLRLRRLSRRDAALVEWLIGELDEHGYLETDLEQLLADLPAELAIEPEEVRTALRLLQSFDPPGVGARDLAECLVLQLRQPDLNLVPELADPEVLELARRVCRDHLTLLAARDYTRLRRELGCSEDELRQVQLAIRRLQPRPGAAFARLEQPYVVPDVIVRKVGKRWRALPNEDARPRLTVHQAYAQAVQAQRGSPLADHLREARWLVRNIQQRYDTIARVAQEIVERQQGFFEHGAIAMRPLVLRDIADAIGMHESTISRVTTRKYMQTPHGTLEFKEFFGSQVATQAGGAASATAVQSLIRQLIEAEDARKPLSDARLTELLAEQGMVVARRTVAKYREILQLPPASQRKQL